MSNTLPITRFSPKQSGFYKEKRSAFNHRDRMQPSLLDRLTNDEPHKRHDIESKKFVSHSKIRQMVLRDLQWLLNCTNNEAIVDLSPYSSVRRSTVNFGVSSLAGKRISEIKKHDIEQSIITAITHFEPRIMPESLTVDCLMAEQPQHNLLAIEIKGLLWCFPDPISFSFLSEIDLENGLMDLKEIG